MPSDKWELETDNPVASFRYKLDLGDGFTAIYNRSSGSPWATGIIRHIDGWNASRGGFLKMSGVKNWAQKQKRVRERATTLYNVIDTAGRNKGLKNNLVPLTRDEAKSLAARQASGKPKLVAVKTRDWPCRFR